MDTQQELDFESGSAAKLTDWKKEPSLTDLKGDFEAAKPAHTEQLGKINKWNDLLSIKGKEKPPTIKNRSSVQPKLIRRQAEWRYSALTEPFLSSKKLFDISPATFEDGHTAKQNELVINNQFRTKIDKLKFIDDYVRCAVDEGSVIVRLGWERHVIEVDAEVPVWEFYAVETEEEVAALQQAMELSISDPRGFSEIDPALQAAVEKYDELQQGVVAKQIGVTKVKKEKILRNQPTVEVLNPANVYIDSSCNGQLSKALFAVISFETNLAELKRDKDRYKNLDKINWENVTVSTESDHETQTPSTFNFHDKTRRKAVAYEYWGSYDIDGDGTLVPIVATWIGNTLIRMERNPFPDQKIPLVMATYLPVKRALYGEPDAELMEENQRILGAVTRGMVDLLGRSANSQRGTAKGSLDPLNLRKFNAGEDYEFNPVNNGPVFEQHKYPEIPNSAITMLSLQNQEAEALSGVKSFSGGLSGESYGDVAAGIRGALDAASKREMAILRRLAAGIKEIGVKICAMNAVFLSDKEVVRITNEQFVTVDREDLAGTFDIEVDISTAEVDDGKAKDLGFMIQTIGPNIDQEITLNILADIADLKRMPELAHKLRTFKPTPDPVAQKMQEMEVRIKELEIEKIQSEIQKNLADARVKSTNADKSDLDYVEQETGTKHARDMQYAEAQSAGFKELEVTKAILAKRKDGESMPNIDAAIGFNHLTDKIDR